MKIKIIADTRNVILENEVNHFLEMIECPPMPPIYYTMDRGNLYAIIHYVSLKKSKTKKD